LIWVVVNAEEMEADRVTVPVSEPLVPEQSVVKIIGYTLAAPVSLVSILIDSAPPYGNVADGGPGAEHVGGTVEVSHSLAHINAKLPANAAPASNLIVTPGSGVEPSEFVRVNNMAAGTVS
jgi:hypothetical protein